MSFILQDHQKSSSPIKLTLHLSINPVAGNSFVKPTNRSSIIRRVYRPRRAKIDIKVRWVSKVVRGSRASLRGDGRTVFPLGRFIEHGVSVLIFSNDFTRTSQTLSPMYRVLIGGTARTLSCRAGLLISFYRSAATEERVRREYKARRMRRASGVRQKGKRRNIAYM